MHFKKDISIPYIFIFLWWNDPLCISLLFKIMKMKVHFNGCECWH